jgi:FG-GAP-like repeat
MEPIITVEPPAVDPNVARSRWKVESNQADAWFGVSVGTAGDVNGDAHDDVIVGAQLYDNGQSAEGRAFVYMGSRTGLSRSAGWTAESNQVQAFFGISVGTAGDVNGDGYDDVVVGDCLPAQRRAQ